MKRVLLFLIFVILLWSCSKKEKPAENIIIGTDTLTEEDLRKIQSGDTLNIIRRNCFLLAASQKSEIKIKDSTLISDFKERLELESGTIWNYKGAELLFKTAQYFKLSLLKNPNGLNNVFKDINILLDEEFRFGLNSSFNEGLPENSDAGYSRKDLETLIGRIFSLNDKTTKVVGEFLYISAENDKKSSDVSKIVSGLVFDSTASKKDAKNEIAPKTAKKIVDNSKELIKYRSLESIKDSIANHSLNIQAIYKKTLKIHEGINGVVYVKFRINEMGRVVDVSISRSEINNKELHENLMSYVRNIKFKAIPEGKGLMTFDFPFEFRPE